MLVLKLEFPIPFIRGIVVVDDVTDKSDQFFPVKDVRATRDALNKQGFDAQLTEIKGHTHDYYSKSDEINKAAWDFLKSVELSADPRYQRYAWPK